jgi:hypothetical protein
MQRVPVVNFLKETDYGDERRKQGMTTVLLSGCFTRFTECLPI